VTTALSVVFFSVIFRHWKQKKDALHLAWWTVGVLLYGVGTATESLITLQGWNETVFRTWYISGALLGGAPLAQGTVHLILSKNKANILSVILIVVVLVAAVCVILSPIDYTQVEQFKPTGKALAWSWVRAFSPFINTYALIFLAGGAAWSAWKYKKQSGSRNRSIGNALIAVGAVLPGIGGTFTRFGMTEVLYVTELIGLALIYAGYQRMRRDTTVSIHTNQRGNSEPYAKALVNDTRYSSQQEMP